MKMDPLELEVFILTCNRSGLLRKAIESLLRQTVPGFPIIVLDNASTDDTVPVVASFQSPRVRLMTSQQNVGGLGNIQRGQQVASRRYVMFFHDDDQLHPEYVEVALSQMGRHDDVALVVSNSVNIVAGVSPVDTGVERGALKLDRAHFAAVCYLKNKLAFSSAVYRTEHFKSVDLAALSAEFGKWGDRPIMIEALQKQKAIMLTGGFTYSGRHEGQDQHSKETQPPHTLWLNRERYFLGILGDDWSSFTGRCFCLQSHRRLKSGYKRRIIKGTTFEEYLRDAFASGATTARAWRLRWVAVKLVQAFFNAYARRYLRRRYWLDG